MKFFHVLRPIQYVSILITVVIAKIIFRIYTFLFLCLFCSFWLPTKRRNGQGSRLLRQRSRVRISGKAWMSNCPSQAPPVAEWVCAKNWQTPGTRFNPQSRLSTQPFRVFHCFLRISRKYGLGYFRKTPTEGAPPICLGPSCGNRP